MAKKKLELNNPMEDYIKSLIDKQLKERDENIKKEDAEEIIKAIMPELESLVSKVVLKHLKAIAQYTLDKLKEE